MEGVFLSFIIVPLIGTVYQDLMGKKTEKLSYPLLTHYWKSNYFNLRFSALKKSLQLLMSPAFSK